MRTLAKRFPQLGLADSPSMNKLREEFTEFCLSTSEHPEIKKYKGVDKVWRPRAGTFWWEVSKIKTLNVEDRFPLLGKLMAGLLSIPAPNADSERGFSILRKIHTEQRPSLKQDTHLLNDQLQQRLSQQSCERVRHTQPQGPQDPPICD